MPKPARKKTKAAADVALFATCPKGHKFRVIADAQRKEKIEQIIKRQVNAVLDLVCPQCGVGFSTDASTCDRHT
jgi:hypothetical protein